jgi:hypothetical protein
MNLSSAVSCKGGSTMERLSSPSFSYSKKNNTSGNHTTLIKIHPN